ncbi:MAG: DUF1638 domain-containing protein [Deltaproteobacteria bacterium]|jgi:hypothetical protein|nr:DUF1638 domain-containing protein [Deltaproteobacteria bacterium]
MAEKRVIIYCGIFDEELELALAPLSHRYEITFIRLKPGYHCLIEELEARLQEALASDLIKDKKDVRLFFGQKCLPDMPEFAKKHGVKVLPTGNCLSAMVGDKKLVELERNRTIVLTPAWIRKMFLSPEGIPATSSWDAADFRMNFGRYDRVLVLETTEPPTDEEILETFDLLGNPIIEFEPATLDHFNKLVEEFLA